MLNKREIDQAEERYFVELYADHLKLSHDQIEYPIISIKQSQLDKGQCIPDAIFYCDNEIKLVEITTFSRCLEMRKRIGEMRKNPKNFHGIMPGTSISEFAPLKYGMYFAISKKISKHYSQAARLSMASSKVLVVALVNDDPFVTRKEFEKLTESIQDEKAIFTWQVDLGDFDEIVWLAYVQNTNNSWEWAIATIVDNSAMQKLRQRRRNKEKILAEIDKRMSTWLAR